MVNLVPNYKIISNPTTFSYKTLPPRMTIFNSLLFEPAGEGNEERGEATGKRIGKREGGRKFAYCTPSFRDRDK